ncbi:MAG: CDP-diacylglycerol--glycerol-3-phosphate 3-phosphatidyltransferase [Aquificaceae bacterium]
MPLAITLFRLFLIVPTLFALELEKRLLAGFFVLLAGVSDWLDGDLARKKGKVSQVGALLDPLVDKVFVLSVLSFFLYKQEVSLVIFLLLLFRELSISFLRSIAVEKGYLMSASYIGKAKAFFEFLALFALTLKLGVAKLLLWFSVFLAYLSMYDYVVKYFKYQDRR